MPEKKRDRKEYQRQYYLKRREELLAKHIQWAKDNPEKHREYSREYKRRKRDTGKSGDVLAALETIKPEEPQE